MNNPRPDEFRVNKWMRDSGFTWDITPGTPASPNPFNGLWEKDGQAFTQEQAVFLYQVWHQKPWWRFWG